jgi:hypothetical protein
MVEALFRQVKEDTDPSTQFSMVADCERFDKLASAQRERNTAFSHILPTGCSDEDDDDSR